MTEASLPPLWRTFDPVWYRQEYKDVLGEAASLSDDALKQWYESQGAFSGHSPNCYFDEEWYRRTCPEALDGLASGQYTSGFDHYCQRGFKTQSPHYLFSERYYTSGPDGISVQSLTEQGFVNGYDHYLKQGDQQNRSGHLFFNPELYLLTCAAEEDAAPEGAFKNLLLADKACPNTVRLSEHFDPVWYARTHPNAVMMVEYGYMPNVLYQFLSEFTPSGL
ncbi:MAG: glycosyl transferase [Acetobacter indonesiensis]|jgi:hypothetical protein|nr:glycosyl transferase [Acetobacter indonesiensis]MCI1547117.1 glycosyl transferase [Acetobacter indonesiensis]MCI1766478.1 glycosyl transferase [Acetobacter indonesiensis]